MSRKKIKKRSDLNIDIKFKSELITKFINLVMKNGKKSISRFIVYKSLDLISKKFNKDALLLFNDILNIVKPIVEIKSRRIGGSTYNVPVDIKDNRKYTLSMKWIIYFSRKRSEKSMELKLYNEFIDILGNKGLTIKKRDEVHKIAESNRAFSHYKW